MEDLAAANKPVWRGNVPTKLSRVKTMMKVMKKNLKCLQPRKLSCTKQPRAKASTRMSLGRARVSKLKLGIKRIKGKLEHIMNLLCLMGNCQSTLVTMFLFVLVIPRSLCMLPLCPTCLMDQRVPWLMSSGSAEVRTLY